MGYSPPKAPGNPYASVAGNTWVGGRANGIAAQQNPQNAYAAMIQARQRQRMGGTTGLPAPTNQELYGDVGYPSYGNGSAGHYGGQPPAQPKIEGYVGNGIQTNDFSNAVGRAPTADDYYNLRNQARTPQVSPYLSPQPKPAVPFPTGPALGAGDPNFNTLPSSALLDAQTAQAKINAPPTSVVPFPTGDPLPIQPDIDHLAKGGPAKAVHPYMIGEKGDEEVVGKDGQKQLIGLNGPEIGTFSEPGKVIPHDKLPPTLRTPVVHRYMGGPVDAAPGSVVAPFIGSGRTPSGLPLFGHGNSGASIFTPGYNPMTGKAPIASNLNFLAEGGPEQASPDSQTLPNAGQRMMGGLYGTDEKARQKRAMLRKGTYRV